MTHSFDVEVAKELGIEKATIIKNFEFWITKNIANDKNIHDDKAWTYNSYEALHKLFPYIKERTLKKLLQELEKDGILVSRNDLNTNKWDKTKWYSFGDSEIVKTLIKLPKIGMPIEETQNVPSNGHNMSHRQDTKSSIDKTQNVPSIMNNNQRQIINTDNKPDKKNNKKNNFSFGNSKSTQYENLSEEYREKLKGYSVSKDGAYSFDEFLDYHIAKGTGFKDWSRAYNTWINNSKKYNKFNPTSYVYEHIDEARNIKMFKEYNSNRLYDAKSYEYIADLKILDTPAVQEHTPVADNSMAINALMGRMAEGVRA